MNNNKMGLFIAGLRKEKQMTQRELAEQLHITDKAVSKWERGLSFPDISLLPGLSEILGVSIDELLNGERAEPEKKAAASVETVLHYADRSMENRVKSVQVIGAAVFSLLLLAGIAVCAICDMAISGGLTWSLVPISSMVFAWFVLFPVIRFWGRGVVGSLAALTVLILPFLWGLDIFIADSGMLLHIGVRMVLVAVGFLWVIFALFRVFRKRKFLAGGIAMLLSIPVILLINLCLSAFVSEPPADIWDVLAFSVLAAGAVIFYILDFITTKKHNSER